MIRQDAEAREAFLTTLDWLIAVSARYSSPIEFGLVHISLGNNNELGEAYGAQDAAKQLVALTQALKKSFRKTDMVARNGTDYWIIVPFSSATEKINDKVREILHSSAHVGLHVVDHGTSVFALSSLLKELDKTVIELTALQLLEHLKTNKQIYAKHVFDVPAFTTSIAR